MSKSKVKMSFLVVILVILGTTSTAWADPKGPQRLRGLDDRVFLVDVDFYVNGVGLVDSFANCYFFTSELGDDGKKIWLESQQPDALGSWKQHSTGASTSYFVTADLPASLFGFPTTLLQLGQVSPAGGKGVLQLEAISTIGEFGDLFEFISVGSEIDEADAEGYCPDPES